MPNWGPYKCLSRPTFSVNCYPIPTHKQQKVDSVRERLFKMLPFELIVHGWPIKNNHSLLLMRVSSCLTAILHPKYVCKLVCICGWRLLIMNCVCTSSFLLLPVKAHNEISSLVCCFKISDAFHHFNTVLTALLKANLRIVCACWAYFFASNLFTILFQDGSS